MYTYTHVFLFMAVACGVADIFMILTEYAGQMFGKEADKWKIKRFAVTAMVAAPSAIIMACSILIPATSVLSFAGMVRIIGCSACAVTFGMQAFYVWM